MLRLGIIDLLSRLFKGIESTHKIELKLNSNVTSIKLNNVKYTSVSYILLNLDKSTLAVYFSSIDNSVRFNKFLLNSYNHLGLRFSIL